jgi:hypothetical protein
MTPLVVEALWRESVHQALFQPNQGVLAVPIVCIVQTNSATETGGMSDNADYQSGIFGPTSPHYARARPASPTEEVAMNP